MSIKTNTTDLQLIIDKLNALFNISLSNAVTSVIDDALIVTGNSVTSIENGVLVTIGSAKSIIENDILKVTNT